jgi:sulfite reductase (NADPH) hemoprotein beta-component
MMMIRGRIPGGVMTPAQWITFDDLATNYGNNTLRITTRQSIQFHGVVKSGLGPLVKEDQRVAALHARRLRRCEPQRDAPPTPAFTRSAREQVQADCVRVADALTPADRGLPRDLDRRRAAQPRGPANKDFVDPLYGKTYLPRKFKVGFVIPPLNDMDIFTNDLGFIAIVEDDRLTRLQPLPSAAAWAAATATRHLSATGRCARLLPPEQLVDVAGRADRSTATSATAPTASTRG